MPDLITGLKTEKPPYINKAKNIRAPEKAPRQKAMIMGSLSISLTKRESGTTKRTPKEVITRPFL